VIDPSAMVKEDPLTALTPPKVLTMFLTLIIRKRK
jgi:hypothetical protein